MKYPWMPLFWGDFLANTMHLSAQEAGAYLFLIAHAWEHDGEIPGERVRLARIAHVRPDQWNKVWNALECFFEIKANSQAIGRTYVHMRVLDELHRLGKISSKRKAAAEQKQRKSLANGVESTSTSNRESSLGKEGKQDFRDKGPDYRAPSSPFKSDNVLQPLLTKAGGR